MPGDGRFTGVSVPHSAAYARFALQMPAVELVKGMCISNLGLVVFWEFLALGQRAGCSKYSIASSVMCL